MKSLATSERARNLAEDAVRESDLVVLQLQEDMQIITQENANMQKNWHDKNDACKRLAIELYQLKE